MIEKRIENDLLVLYCCLASISIQTWMLTTAWNSEIPFESIVSGASHQNGLST